MTRPINADVEAEAPAAKRDAPPRRATPGQQASPPAVPGRRRRPLPGALAWIAALALLAIGLIAAAVLGAGSGGGEPEEAPAPVVVERPLEEGGGEEATAPGYPALATSNTTRVWGADPAANAAGVALAVYPSREESQRPTAATVVDSGDWHGAIAAAVLMAQPLGAPLLVSEGGALPEATERALEALSPRGRRRGTGTQAFLVGGAAAPPGLRAERIGARGGNPAARAAAIARARDRLLGSPPRHIVVAPLSGPSFAMPAAGWAARSGDPVLFAARDRLPRPTAAALRRHADLPVYVLGPSAAISSAVVRKIARISDSVSRVSGEDPVANAIALARYDDAGFGWNVNDPGHGFVLARAGSPLDAAAAAPLSASGTWGPLLLTDNPDTLPAALRDYMLDLKPGYTTDPTRAFYNHVWVIGDEEAIDVNQQAKIDQLAELARIGGEP